MTKSESETRLREWIKPGDTVYTVLDHVSRSGMCRHIRVLLVRVDDKGKPYFLHPNYAVAQVLGVRQARRDGLVVRGCGMDMGFHVVSSLAEKLFGDYKQLRHEWI